MVSLTFRRLLLLSEVVITIWGTLLGSAGINLITSSVILNLKVPDRWELLPVIFGIVLVYWSVVIFCFLERRRVLDKLLELNDELIVQQKEENCKEGPVKLPKKRKEIKEDFEKEQLKHDDTKRLLYAIRLGWGLVIIVLCLYVSAFFISGCKSNTKSNHVIIGYQEIALYRHLFTAIERGYFDQEKVKVEVRPFVSANQMIQAMIAGKLDATGLSNMEVALSVESKDPDRFELVNMLVWKDNSFPDYILARKGSDIDSLKQLEGHVVGLHPGSAVRGFSKAVLEYFGLDLSGISFLELKPAIMQSSVSAGRVDGVYCMDPVATTLVETGEAHVLVANPLKYIFAPPIPISGTALSKILINERPDDARKIIRALEKAIIYMRQPGHEDEIAGYIAKYTPISPEMSLKMNDSEYWTTEEIDRERIQALADKFIELEIIDKAVEITNIMIPKDFLEKK